MDIEHMGEPPTRALLITGSDLSPPFYRNFTQALAHRGLGTTVVGLPGLEEALSSPAPSFRALVDAVLRLVPGPELLIGHSLGGLLALLAAARRPASARKLVLLEPTVFPSRLVAKFAARRYLRDVVRGPRDHFVNHNGLSRRASRPRAYPAEMIQLYLDTRRRTDPRTMEALFLELPELYPLPYADIKLPTLLVSGGDIGPLARWMRRDLVHRLRPRQVDLPGAAHWLVNEDDEALADLVLEFSAAPRVVGPEPAIK